MLIQINQKPPIFPTRVSNVRLFDKSIKPVSDLVQIGIGIGLGFSEQVNIDNFQIAAVCQIEICQK